MTSIWKHLAFGSMLVAAVACGGGSDGGGSGSEPTPPPVKVGKYMTGEIHNHTGQSNDIQTETMTLENLLGVAFRNMDIINKDESEGLTGAKKMFAGNIQHGKAFDYMFFADHLRNSYNSNDGMGKSGGTYDTPLYKALETQFEGIKQMQASNPLYKDKIVYSGFEWDVPMLDHAAVGIIDSDSDDIPYEAIREFEWRFAREHEENYSRNHSTELDIWGINDCDADDTNDTEDTYEYGKWGYRQQPDDSAENGNLCKAFDEEVAATVETTYAGLAWLRDNHPESYLLMNHPSRHAGELKIEHIRQMHDTAPNILLGVEGLVGGMLTNAYGDLPATAIRGRADEMVSITGGVWDSLLAEGRRIHNFTNSDFHFKQKFKRIYETT